MDLSGTWKPVRRQTTIGQTPFRSVKENALATIIIEEDGIHGWIERKILFGRFLSIRKPILVGRTGDPELWLIIVDDFQATLFATLDENGYLVTGWKSEIRGLDGTCIVYERR